MFGNIGGPTLIVLSAAVILIILIALTVTLIVMAVNRGKRSRAAQQADLQRAYEAGLSQREN